jgi:hypothetical protein
VGIPYLRPVAKNDTMTPPCSRFFLLCFALAMTSCRGAQSRSDTAEQMEPEAPFVQFYALHISRDSTAAAPRSQVRLLKITSGKGQMKSSGETALPGENYLTVYRRAGKKTLDSAVLSHPLFLHLEHSDEAGRYATKQVALDSAQFFFRLPGRREADNLRVMETLLGSAKTELGILKIFER